jgi:alpha-N-acetylglucosamine transferase
MSLINQFAFVLVHFGDKSKYLELELYLVINLRNYTKYDIVYMYSINDTPVKFIEIMKEYCTKVIPYDDNNITFNITNFKSSYTNFNTLRTCNFLFAYQLTEYKKICVIESDMIILKNIDDIFELNTPTILTFYQKKLILENYIIKIDSEITLNNCNSTSMANGGIMLFEPSISIYNLLLKNIEHVIEKNCIYPNETLFLLSYEQIYNLPFKYNGVKYHINGIGSLFTLDMKSYLSVIHFNAQYKHIDIIKDGYLEDIKQKNKILYYFLIKYKKEYYDKYNNQIFNLISSKMMTD